MAEGMTGSGNGFFRMAEWLICCSLDGLLAKVMSIGLESCVSGWLKG